MTRRSDKAHVARIKTALDRLWDACLAARKAGLSVTLDTTWEDAESVADVPRVDAHISRDYSA